ncbi:MAG TPA: type II secretion system protein, partial [Xanthomonadales bacterium]|nr:type II secretion system protein [Xanthomonadales bacterium]
MKKLLLLRTKFSSNGFTLIELLVVIAILGILAVGLISTIDPVDKINAGNDAKAFSDVTLMSKAAESYAASNNGAYPDATSIVGSGELRSIPSAPSGYTYTPTYVSGNPG